MDSLQNSLQFKITNKQILKLTLPVSIAILVPQLNFITNNIFLGHYSTTTLAVASITGVYYLIFASIGFALNNGLLALISRRAGENRPDEIGKIFNQGIFTALLIAAVAVTVSYTFTPTLLRSILHEPEKAEMAISFIQIRIWGLPFLYIYQLRNALLVGTNQSRYMVMGTVAEAIANVVFDYTLIFGKWGLPELGFNGAAYASIIAEFVGMFVIYIVIHQKGIAQQYALFKNLRWDKKNASLITAMSAPLVFQHAISIMSWELFYILIERNQPSDNPQAISNVMRNVFGMFGCMSWAFASTSNSMVSNIIGQGKHEQVIPVIKKIVKLSTGIALVLCLFLNLFPHLFLSIFGQSDEFIQQGIPVIRVVSLAMILMSFSVVWLHAVTGTGNTKVTFLIEAVTIILYCVFIYVVLEKLKLSITIGWMSEWLYWTCMFIPAFFYLRSGRWKKKVI
ncbi:MAG TPA: MATE family efflux transporter [Chitinophagaceae bacterium]